MRLVILLASLAGFLLPGPSPAQETPRADAEPSPEQGILGLFDEFQLKKAKASYEATLLMKGKPSGCRRSYGYGPPTEEYSAQLWIDALADPEAFIDENSHFPVVTTYHRKPLRISPREFWADMRKRTILRLIEWAKWGPWNYNVFARFASSTGEYGYAEEELTPFFQARHGMDEEKAYEVARYVRDIIIARSFTFGVLPGSASEDLIAAHGYRIFPWDAFTTYTDYTGKHEGDRIRRVTAAFREALLSGASIEDLKKLVEMGAELEGATESAIFFAVGRPEQTDFLLSLGVDINSRNKFGKTPLMYGAQLEDGGAGYIKFMLSKGADPNLATKKVSECGYNVTVSGKTALMYAAENNNPGHVEELLRHGADPTATDSRGWTADDYSEQSTYRQSIFRSSVHKMLEAARN